MCRGKPESVFLTCHRDLFSDHVRPAQFCLRDPRYTVIRTFKIGLSVGLDGQLHGGDILVLESNTTSEKDHMDETHKSFFGPRYVDHQR